MIFKTDKDILKFLVDNKENFGEFHLEAVTQTLNAVDHIVKNNVEGCLIEIGVYKGIMVIAMIAKLLQLNVLDREIHLYDTFSGMTEPSDIDIDPSNVSASNKFDKILCYCTLDDVKTNISMMSYPSDKIIYHKGDIRKCDISLIPSKISFLRLDTDFYDSTKFELNFFEPNVVNNGIITLDDYNWWVGCTKATDEYIEQLHYKVMKHTMKPHGMWWIKTQS